MNDLIIEYKPGVSKGPPFPIQIPVGKFVAVLQGGDFLVKTPTQAQQLYAYVLVSRDFPKWYFLG